jgi:hypothetical protein
MAITLRGTAADSVINGANATVNLPAGTAQNDVVYAAFIESTAATNLNLVMATAGYTELADLYADDVIDANLGVFRKRQGATPDSTAVADGSGVGADGVSLAVVVLIGVDTTTSEDATTTTATGISSPTPDPPSITTVTNNAWVIAIGGSTEPDIPTAPTNYTNLIESNEPSEANPSNIMMATREIVSFGAENPGTFGGIVGDMDDSWCAATVAVRPAAVAALPPRPTIINQAPARAASW